MPYFNLWICTQRIVKYISRMDCAKDLPVDVLGKLFFIKLETLNMKIKYCHIEALKRIQNKYTISRLGPKIAKNIWNQEKHIIEYCIMREGVPFSLKSSEDIITEEKKNCYLQFMKK